MNKEQYKAYLRQRLNEGEKKWHNVDLNNPADKRLWDDMHRQHAERVVQRNITSHPHGELTRVLARHLGLDAPDVFEITRPLTKDSPQEHVDAVVNSLIDEHGGKIWNKLSAEPGSLYHTPTARYGSTPERDFDARDAHDTEVERQYGRFMEDFTQHIHAATLRSRLGNGTYKEFKGIPRADGT